MSERVPWESALLAAFAAGLTVAAWQVYPAWDDGWLWLQAHGRSAGLEASMTDRPFLGWLWARLVDAGLLLPLSVGLHWAGWFGLGWATAGLWRRWFPAHPRLAVVAALLAMGTVSLQIQHVLIVGVWGVLAPTVLVDLALLVLLPVPERPAPAAPRARLAAAALLAAGATLISEYGLVTAVTVAALLLLVRPRGDGRGALARRGAWVVLAAAFATYILFLAFADHAVRDATSPDHFLVSMRRRLLALPFHLASELWQGALGNLLLGFGRLEVHSRQSLVLALASALVAAAVLWLLRRRQDEGGAADLAESRRGALALVAAMVPALLLMLAVGRRLPWQGLNSRYLLPVAAPLACLTLWLVLRIARREWGRGIAVAVAFAVTFVTLQDANARIAERRRVERLAPALVPHLDPQGFNLVVLVPRDENVVSQPVAGYELTARLARRLPAGVRDRLWAVRYDAMHDQGVRGVGPLAAPGELPSIEITVRGLARRQPVERVIWVEVDRRDARVTSSPARARRGPPAGAASGAS